MQMQVFPCVQHSPGPAFPPLPWSDAEARTMSLLLQLKGGEGQNCFLVLGKTQISVLLSA